MCVWIDISFREPKINHVNRLLIRRSPDDAVSQLNISVEYALLMHKLQSHDLRVAQRIRNKQRRIR